MSTWLSADLFASFGETPQFCIVNVAHVRRGHIHIIHSLNFYDLSMFDLLPKRLILALSSCNMLSIAIYYCFFILSMSFVTMDLIVGNSTFAFCFDLLCGLGGLAPIALAVCWLALSYVRGDEVIDFLHKRVYVWLLGITVCLTLAACVCVRFYVHEMSHMGQIYGCCASLALGGLSYLFLSLVPERLPNDEL